MTAKGFAPARGHRGARMYARRLVSAGLTLWLMPGAVGAQQRSADLFKGQVVRRRRADPEVQNQIEERQKK